MKSVHEAKGGNRERNGEEAVGAQIERESVEESESEREGDGVERWNGAGRSSGR